jgi:DNA (cytosine-5)-methyltransferase 1
MGFSEEHLGFKFRIPVSDTQAYRQFGNSVVVPQFNWVGKQILNQARSVFAERMKKPRSNEVSARKL